ncbi:MAG: TetR family transcriptional regulator [Sedimentisphaerales bacterium]|nr:TetR family transcriptional regulator [Sedimentisphaerales bacterium]
MVSKSELVDPKQKRAIRSKIKILNAARVVFAEKGLHGARIDDISRRAGLNKQRIYAYFGSKKGVYRQVLLHAYAQVTENEAILALREQDIPQMTQIVIEAFFKFHQENPLFWRLFSWENLNGGKSLSENDWKNIRSSYIDHLQYLYEIGQKRNIFKKEISFFTFLMTLYAVTNFYFSNRLTISHLLDRSLDDMAQCSLFTHQAGLMMQQGILANNDKEIEASA